MLIYGAGGHAKVIISLLSSSGIEVTAVFDDNPQRKACAALSVSNYDPSLHADQPMIIGVGDNFIRKKLAAYVGHRFANAFHFSSLIGHNVLIGVGNVILHHAIIQTDTIIGNHCIINTAASVDHDCRIADFVHIGPGCVLCGHVTVGDCTLVGAGSVVVPNIIIGKNCLIGAGSVVTRDGPSGVLAVGIPVG